MLLLWSRYDKDETGLLDLLTHGPVSVSIDASTWNDYQGGIIQYHCGGHTNHAVQIVGYDRTGTYPQFRPPIALTTLSLIFCALQQKCENYGSFFTGRWRNNFTCDQITLLFSVIIFSCHRPVAVLRGYETRLL